MKNCENVRSYCIGDLCVRPMSSRALSVLVATTAKLLHESPLCEDRVWKRKASVLVNDLAHQERSISGYGEVTLSV